MAGKLSVLIFFSLSQRVSRECRQPKLRLSWSHYRVLLQVLDVTARKWYEKEVYEQTRYLLEFEYRLNCHRA